MLTTIKQLRSLLSKKEKLEWLAIACFATFNASLEVLTAATIVALAQAINNPNKIIQYFEKFNFLNNISNIRIIFYFAIICGITYFVKNMFTILEVFFQNFSIQRMNYRFKNKLLYKFANMDYSLYLTRNSSYGINVISHDVEQLFSVGLLSLSAIISEIFVFLFLCAFIIYLNPSFAIFMSTLAFIIGIFLKKFLLPKFHNWGKKLQSSSLHSTHKLIQFFQGFKEILLLGKKENFINAYKIYSKQRSLTIAIHTSTNSIPKSILETLFVGLFIVAICYLCLQHNQPIQMITIISGYLYLGFRAMPGLNRIIGHLSYLKISVPNIERIYKEYNFITSERKYLDIPNFKFNTNIILKNVSFKYTNTENNVLKDIDLKIDKGDFIGVVGETGSGKSTLIDLILGLLEPQNGSILIDGKYPANCKQWHKIIGYVPQSIYLIDDTIEANISFGEKKENIDSVKLQKVIKHAQLEKLIKKLPNGTKTIVGERGVRLSGGERQRIAIARALYYDPKVLLFDEATSALDNTTEAKLMNTINAISKDYTVIMIAHRINTLKNCNYIIEISNGKITFTNQPKTSISTGNTY